MLFVAHSHVWRNGTGDEGVACYGTALANNGFTAKNGCIRVNCYIVLNGRVTFTALQALSCSSGKSAQGNTLINFYVLTNDSGFTDYYACSMVDKEIFAEGSTRMDICTSTAVCMFSHDTWNHRNT